MTHEKLIGWTSIRVNIPDNMKVELHTRQQHIDDINRKWEEEELPKCEAAWVDKELNGNYPEGKEWWMDQMRSNFCRMDGYEYMLYLDDWVRDGPFYVVEYSSSQCYGGPEEGGWYATVTPVSYTHLTLPTNREV